MAVNINNDRIMPDYSTMTRTSQFRVRDISAFRAALSLYPNILIHVVDDHRDTVRLTTRDGTWFTHFDRGMELCCVDEILAEHLREGEIAHLYLIGCSDTDVQFTRYSVDDQGRWKASTRDDEESLIAQQLRNVKVEDHT